MKALTTDNLSVEVRGLLGGERVHIASGAHPGTVQLTCALRVTHPGYSGPLEVAVPVLLGEQELDAVHAAALNALERPDRRYEVVVEVGAESFRVFVEAQSPEEAQEKVAAMPIEGIDTGDGGALIDIHEGIEA